MASILPGGDAPRQSALSVKTPSSEVIDGFIIAGAHLSECLLRHPPDAIRLAIADCSIQLQRTATAIGWSRTEATLRRILNARPRPPLRTGEYELAQVAIAKATAALLYARHGGGSVEETIHCVADCIRELTLLAGLFGEVEIEAIIHRKLAALAEHFRQKETKG